MTKPSVSALVQGERAKLREARKESVGKAAVAVTPAMALVGLGAEAIRSKSDPSRIDRRDTTANFLSKTSTGALSGAAIGTKLAPGVGTAIGALLGGAIGAVTSSRENRNMLEAQNRADIVDANTISAMQSDALSGLASMNKKRTANYSIPGFDKGVGKFYSNKRDGEHNAYLASEEVVLSPSGKIEVVPGKYNKSNPDVVPASLADGSGVLPKNDKFKLPFGDSTPADIGKRMAKIQKKNHEIMNKIRVSKIDKNTALINENNIAVAKEKVSNLAEIMRTAKSKKKGSVPAYDEGKKGHPSGDLNEKLYRGTGAAALAIGAFNALSQASTATPEKFVPILNAFSPLEHSSNIISRVNDIRARENIARYNSRISGRNTGLSNAVNAATQFNTNRAMSAEFDSIYRQILQNKNINRQGYIETINANKAEMRRVADLNARNRAAARAIRHDAVNNIAEMIMPKKYPVSLSPSDLMKLMN